MNAPTDVESGILLDLEEVPCALCGSAETTGTPVFRGHDVEFRTCDNSFTFVECSQCGHWYLSPKPKDEDIDKIYANYLTHNDASAYYPSGLVAWVKRNVFDRRRLSAVLNALRDGSKVLEIGAGSGQQLEYFGEICPGAIELYANDIAFDTRARESLASRGIRQLEGAIEKIATPLRFDAIIGVHVIEHVSDPVAVFRWISDHLADGGVLYFETPDTAAVARHLFKDNWGMTHFPRHFHLFSREKLSELARDSGLEIVRHRATTSAPAWNMSIRNTMKMDALTRHDSIFEMFNYRNVFTLSFFTAVDLICMLLGFGTSTQQLVAKKPIP